MSAAEFDYDHDHDYDYDYDYDHDHDNDNDYDHDHDHDHDCDNDDDYDNDCDSGGATAVKKWRINGQLVSNTPVIMRILRAAAVALLVGAFLWGLSVFGSTRTPDLERLFLLVCIPAATALAGLFGRLPYRLGSSPLILAVGAFLFWKVAWSGTVEARGYVVLALGWMAFLLTVAIAGRGLRSFRWFVFGLMAVGLLEALYGLAQAVGGFDYIGGYHRDMGRIATGTLFNRNHFAGFLNLMIPLALGSLLAGRVGRRASSRGPRSEQLAAGWVVVLTISLMVLAVLLSQSRAGAVSLVLSLALVAALMRAGRRGRGGWAAWGPLLVLILAVGLGLGLGLQGLLTKFESSETGLRGRTTIYLDTLGLIADHPLTGVGPGLYAWRFRPYQSVAGNVWYDYAHNDYLQTAAEWGLPAALAFWVWVLWRFFQSAGLFFGSRDPWIQGVSLGCAASLCSILLHSMVDFNLYIPTTFMVFCSVLGLSVAAQRLDARLDESREDGL